MNFTCKKITLRKIIVIIFIIIMIYFVIILFTDRNNDSKGRPDNKDQELILQIPDDLLEELENNSSIYIENKQNDLIYKSHGNGTCSLIEIGNKKATEIQIPTYAPNGDIITKISSTAFKNCTTITSITLPSSIKEIDPDAFIECNSLVAIMTSSSNTKFCSVGGVLFSKDKTILVCYPQNKIGSSYLLNINTKKIGKYAFYKVNNLQKILYEDSVQNFSSIEIESGNQCFQKLTITCNYKSEKS